MLVVVAHPDDETFGCGSVLAHAASRGVETVVACATRGEAGSDAADIAVIRERELRDAATVLGVRRVELLGWIDSGMDGEPAPGTLVAAPLDEVARAVAALVDDVRPDVVVTLDASDGHRDHAHVRDATLLAVDHATWHTPRVYLQCLPQRLMRRWVRELQAKQPDSDHLALGDLGTPDELVTTILDTAEHLALRERAIAIHASQTSPYEVMADDLRREFLATDRLRRVRPEWSGGPLETELFGPEQHAPA